MAFIEPIKVLLDIIKTEMSLDDDRVLIYNQKWNMPNEKDIFISLSFSTNKIYGNRITYEDRDDGFYEVQNLNVRENIIINILSYDNTARTRKEEIVLALRSTYAQQQMEANSIKVFSIPVNFADLSSAEASKILNRYSITVPIFSWRTKEKTVEYYDDFDYSILTNK